MFTLTLQGVDIPARKITYVQLCSLMGSPTPDASRPAAVATFQDDEGDTCTIASQLEFAEAQRLAELMAPRPLEIRAITEQEAHTAAAAAPRAPPPASAAAVAANAPAAAAAAGARSTPPAAPPASHTAPAPSPAAPPAAAAVAAAAAAAAPPTWNSMLMFYLNGKKVEIENPDPKMLLVDYLRDVAQLKGTKIGCAEGGCGACTVMISFADAGGGVRHLSANSCLKPLCAVDGMNVTTVEGVGSQRAGFHPVQERMAQCNGTQCGFCSPGWVMNMYSLLRDTQAAAGSADAAPDTVALEKHFDGNLCRCTGYRPILHAFKSFASDAPTTAAAAAAAGAAAAAALEAEDEAKSSAVDEDGFETSVTVDEEGWDVLDATSAEKEGAAAAAAAAAAGGSSGGCCGGGKKAAAAGGPDDYNPDAATLRKMYPYVPGTEPPLPAELVHYTPVPLRFEAPASAGGGTWYRPTSKDSLIALLAATRASGARAGARVKLTCGNTSIGVEKYYNGSGPNRQPTAADVHVDVRCVPDLQQLTLGASVLRVGGAVTLSALIAALQAHAAASPAAFGTMATHISHVAHAQVRNVGSWAGNLMLAAAHKGFPSDVALLLAAANASLEVVNVDDGSVTDVPVADFMGMSSAPSANFALLGGARAVRAAAAAGTGGQQLLLAVNVPLPSGSAPSTNLDTFESFKIMPRNQNAHAMVNAAFNLTLGLAPPAHPAVAAAMTMPGHTPSGAPLYEITAATVVVGGVTKHTTLAVQCAAAMVGKIVGHPDALPAILAGLRADVAAVGLAPDVGSVTGAYRQNLVEATLYKAMLRAYAATGKATATPTNPLSPAVRSAAAPAMIDARGVSDGMDVFQDDEPEDAPVGRTIPKLAGRLQCAGGATFTDDEAAPPGMLHGAIVYSVRALATLSALDAATHIAAIAGAVDVVTAADVKGANSTGIGGGDCEMIFVPVGGVVRCVGAAIGLALGTTRVAAEALAAAVSSQGATYGPAPATEGDSGHPILTLKAAIAANSFHPNVAGAHDKIERGDVDGAFASCKHVSTGTLESGAQRHFYFEPQTCLAMPAEGGGLELRAATQWPSQVQAAVADAVALPANAVSVQARRAGGGFGGKLTRCLPTATAAGVACAKHGVAVRVTNSRDTDFAMIGGRQPMAFTYKVGYDDAGLVQAYEVEAFMDGGCEQEANWGCMDMGMLWADNAYFFANYRMTAKVCKTNLPPNTAMRSPGVVQTGWATECIVQRVAAELKLSPAAVQELNFYKVGELTPYLQPITYLSLPAVWAGLKATSGYDALVAGAAAFNAANRFRKRGVSITPAKFGMRLADYRSGATVRVYAHDGTVVVAHGGTEIGQGIHTKVAQTAAFTLGCPLDAITVAPTATPSIANNTATGGSGTSESSCMAMQLACAPLKERLAPFLAAENATWASACAAAAAAGVSLNSEGWYAPDTEYAFTYFIYCAAVSELELDVLTGEHVVTQSFINYDCGMSLNPAVDIGQIEGAFVMGIGLFTSEEVAFGADGVLATSGTWEYKPPCSRDIPLKMRVDLLPHAPNPVGVLRSKAVGEPPYTVANTVYFALKECVAAARAESRSLSKAQPPQNLAHFEMPSPATAATLQSLCCVTPDDFDM